jgi:hypothetical protein
MNPTLRRLISFISASLLSIAVGIVGVAQNGWFGSGDLRPYAIYCIPFALILWASASLFFRVTRRWHSWIAAPTGFVLGAIVGFIGTYAVAIVLGPWFGAMSVPMLKSWCVTGAIFIPLLYLIRKDGLGISSIVGGTALLGSGLVLFFALSPIWALATGNQHLTTAFFQHVPGDEEFKIDNEPDWLTNEDRDLLESCGLKGRLECFSSGGSNSTEWPRAKAFVIFTSDLSKTVRLPQPKNATILYVQRGDDFIALPNGTPTFDRALEFYEDQDGWHYWVEMASGAKSGGGITLKPTKPNKTVDSTPTRVTSPASSLRSGQEPRHGQP